MDSVGVREVSARGEILIDCYRLVVGKSMEGRRSSAREFRRRWTSVNPLQNENSRC